MSTGPVTSTGGYARIGHVSASYKIGLTGDAGSGKTTVLEWLAAQGAATYDADAAVHARLSDDPEVKAAVVAEFGPGVKSATGEGIDRAALARLVFGAPEALAALERLLHPVVTEDVLSWMAQVDAPVAAVEAVKLVESGLHEKLDEVWLITCESSARRRRLAERGWTEQEIDRRLEAAPPMAPRLAVAAVVIDTSGSFDATTKQLERAWQRALRLARRRSKSEGG